MAQNRGPFLHHCVKGPKLVCINVRKFSEVSFKLGLIWKILWNNFPNISYMSFVKRKGRYKSLLQSNQNSTLIRMERKHQDIHLFHQNKAFLMENNRSNSENLYAHKINILQSIERKWKGCFSPNLCFFGIVLFIYSSDNSCKTYL